MALIDTLAQAIAQMEGFNVSGSIAQRNNNPGNLRASPYAIGKDTNGYAIFPDSTTGWNALNYQLSLYSQRGMDLEQMINVYAPAGDNNDPNSYLHFITGKLGVGPSTTISSLYDNSTVPSDVFSSDSGSNSNESGFATLDFLSGVFSEGDGGIGGVGIGLGLLGVALVVAIVS